MHYTLEEITTFMNKRDIGETTLKDQEIAEYVEEKLNETKRVVDLDK